MENQKPELRSPERIGFWWHEKNAKSNGARKWQNKPAWEKCKIKRREKLQNKTPLLGRTLKENPVPVQFHFVCELRTLEGFGDWERNWKRLPVSLQSGIFWDIVKVESFGTSLTYCQQILSALAVSHPPIWINNLARGQLKEKIMSTRVHCSFWCFPVTLDFASIQRICDRGATERTDPCLLVLLSQIVLNNCENLVSAQDLVENHPINLLHLFWPLSAPAKNHPRFSPWPTDKARSSFSSGKTKEKLSAEMDLRDSSGFRR